MAPGEVSVALRTQFSAPGRKERAGLGVVPTRLADCGPLWKRPLDHAGLHWRLESLHRPYHAALAAELRSEEHTSELQSLMRISYAVFCLKKKITDNTTKYRKRHAINSTNTIEK